MEKKERYRILDRFGLVQGSRATALSMAGIAIFLLLTVLVNARLLASVDLATTQAVRDLTATSGRYSAISVPLDSLGTAASLLFSSEMSLFWALLISLFLWQRGCGRRSLAPFALLLLVGIELVMKLIVRQPIVPAEFHRSVYYPFASVNLSGSFPSGHMVRASFLCTFFAALFSTRRGMVARLALCGLVLLVAIVGFTRIYLGDHWLSDVVASLILGTAVALLSFKIVERDCVV